MGTSAIAFKSGNILLEGLVTTPDNLAGPYPAIVVCHSHPSFQGHMNEKIITSICNIAGTFGLATFRFNFRGTGGSEGFYDGEHGARKDVKAALNIARRWPGFNAKKITLVGYSYGAAAIMDGSASLKKADKFILISPPSNSASRSKLRRDNRPLLIISGEKDRLSPPERILGAFSLYKKCPQIEIISNADFSLAGFEDTIGKMIGRFATSESPKNRFPNVRYFFN